MFRILDSLSHLEKALHTVGFILTCFMSSHLGCFSFTRCILLKVPWWNSFHLNVSKTIKQQIVNNKNSVNSPMIQL